MSWDCGRCEDDTHVRSMEGRVGGGDGAVCYLCGLPAYAYVDGKPVCVYHYAQLISKKKVAAEVRAR
ncbi:hypothetical protein [Thermofilum pendens]|uniref:Uncharacterized protein n=1 Tax=Thermofilum pendens (strain DSM 2475 / Hrk 5) TaxID=368408 RepID=A1S1D2_THEPD|nr:hypothetical protein [Thermofilum pendens]ABL79262.1 hypothetical protein Tpen_1867 [Thermofilum pendens Hrk 5]